MFSTSWTTLLGKYSNESHMDATKRQLIKDLLSNPTFDSTQLQLATRTIFEAAPALLATTHISLWQLDTHAEITRIVCRASSQLPAMKNASIELNRLSKNHLLKDLNKGIPVTIKSDEALRFINNIISTDDRTFCLGCLLVQPIIHKNELLGVLFFESETKNKTWDGDDLITTDLLAHLLTKPLHGSLTHSSLPHINITKNQTLLQQQTALYKSIIKFSLMSVANVDGRTVDINDNYLELTGFSRQEVIGQPQSIFNSQVQPKLYFTLMWRLLKEKKVWQGRICNQKKNGDHFWLQATITPMLNSQEEIEGYFGFYHDITAQVDTEQQLNQSEKLTNLGSFRIKKHQTFWHGSKHLHSMLGVPQRESIREQYVCSIIADEDRERFTRKLQQLHCDELQAELTVKTQNIKTQFLKLTAKSNHQWIIGSFQDVTDQALFDEDLHQTIMQQNTIFDSANVILIATELDGTISHLNKTTQKLLNYEPQEVIGIETPLIFFDQSDIETKYRKTSVSTENNFSTLFDKLTALSVDRTEEQEWLLRRKDGSQIPFSLSVSPMLSNQQVTTGFVFIGKDLTRLKAAEQQNTQLTAILSTAGELADFGGFQYKVAEDELQLTQHSIQRQLTSGQSRPICLNDALSICLESDKNIITQSIQRLKTAGEPFDVQVRVRTNKEGFDWLRIAARADWQDGEFTTVLGFFHTINDQKKLEQRLSSLALTDELTGIPNRRALLQALDLEWNRHRRYRTPASILLFDIDWFKQVNDRFGHDSGDLVLKEFSKRVRRKLRSSDHFGRLGGEEFLVLASNTDLEEATALAEKLRQVIAEQPFVFHSPQTEAIQLSITTSIGIASLCQNIEYQEQWLIFADQALYQAKTQGRNKAKCYQPTPVSVPSSAENTSN